jgi:hypothetical protein
MKVQVFDDAGTILWEREGQRGVSSRGYMTDGTQQRIVTTLQTALEQAEAELRLFNEANRVLDSSAATVA